MLRGSQQPEKANAADAFRDATLDAAGRALWRHDGHDLVVAGVSAWAGPGLVLDVARRPAAEVVQPGASALSHDLESNLDCWLANPDLVTLLLVADYRIDRVYAVQSPPQRI